MATFINLDNLAQFLAKLKGLITGAASDAREGAVSDVKQLGYQTAAQVESTVTSKGYQTSSQVDSKIDAAMDEMQSSIDSAVSSAYRVKGSCAFADLPALTAAKVGDVWNITNAFTTTDDYVEGAGRKYPAGTNVVRVTASGKAKWDVLAGVTDLSGYWAKSELTAATDEQIDALFD